MRAFYFTFVLIFIFQGQASVPVNPQCANVCEVENYTVSGCTAFEYKCLCQSSAFFTASTNCILLQCNSAEVNAARDYTLYICGLYGVSVASAAVTPLTYATTATAAGAAQRTSVSGAQNGDANTPTSSSDNSGSYSQSDKIALGTGIGIGVPAFLVALTGLIYQLRKWYRR